MPSSQMSSSLLLDPPNSNSPFDPKPGVYGDVPMALYHHWIAASNSRLSKLRRSPAHLRAYLDEPPEDTRALAIGRAIHTTILEPHLFDTTFVVASQCTATKKGDGLQCTNGGAQLHAQHGWLCGIHTKGVSDDFVTDKIVLPESDFRRCEGIRASIYSHAAAAKLLRGAQSDVELSMAWVDAESGVRCKGRIDRLARHIPGGAMVDIKSTRDASPREFERSIFAHGYHRQAAFYLDGAAALGFPAEHFVIVAVEKEPPYAVAVYRLTEGAIEGGREQLRPLLARYGDCVARNEWPGYSEDVQDIALPAWSWQQIDEEVASS